MEFKLTINCDTAAFGEEDEQDQRLDEVARILRYAADQVVSGLIAGRTLRDINGNTVGSFELTE